MSGKYRVMVVGMGKRGKHHATAFSANPRFQVVGICDIDKARTEAAAGALGNPAQGTDARALAMELKPDVFCFCTLPSIRLDMVDIGVKCGAKLIAFEKPVALTSAEGMKIRKLIEKKRVKAVVSHQHRYGEHYRKVKEIVASGALGRVHTVYGTATGWMAHMMSHMIDYARWYAGNPDATWVMAQAAGQGKFADIHSSPDYIGAFVQFANGVRGYFETGAGAPDQPEVEKWWGKNRIGAQGTEGFAEVLTNGGWRAVTKSGGMQSGGGAMNYDLDMPPYIQDMADWLDNGKEHPCSFRHAWQGFEIMMGMCRSVVKRGQVALPLQKGMDELKAIRKAVPTAPVLLSSQVNEKEYFPQPKPA